MQNSIPKGVENYGNLGGEVRRVLAAPWYWQQKVKWQSFLKFKRENQGKKKKKRDNQRDAKPDKPSWDHGQPWPHMPCFQNDKIQGIQRKSTALSKGQNRVSEEAQLLDLLET